jgi:hypothetical protein
MADKHLAIKGGAPRAPTLSDAEWTQFASEELSRYLYNSKASQRNPLVNVRPIDSHLLDDDLPPDIGMLLGMRGWIGTNGQ